MKRRHCSSLAPVTVSKETRLKQQPDTMAEGTCFLCKARTSYSAHGATCRFLRVEPTFVKPAGSREIGLPSAGNRRAETCRSSPQESTVTAEHVLVVARRSNSRGRMALGGVTSIGFHTTEGHEIRIDGLVEGCKHDQRSRREPGSDVWKSSWVYHETPMVRSNNNCEAPLPM